jgi:hypothetical protein
MLSTLATLILTLTPGICNGNLAEEAGRPPTTRLATRAFVGLNVKDARTCAEHLGWKFRVVRRNDRSLPRTLDRRRDRVNVTVYQGQVVGLYVG